MGLVAESWAGPGRPGRRAAVHAQPHASPSQPHRSLALQPPPGFSLSVCRAPCAELSGGGSLRPAYHHLPPPRDAGGVWRGGRRAGWLAGWLAWRASADLCRTCAAPAAPVQGGIHPPGSASGVGRLWAKVGNRTASGERCPVIADGRQLQTCRLDAARPGAVRSLAVLSDL